MGTVQLGRAQVFHHRVLASGLDRSRSAADLELWRLGVQDRDGSAPLALLARVAGPEAVPEIGTPGSSAELVQLWSMRGSPHVHRRQDVDSLAAALWPLSAADAWTRLAGSGKVLKDAGTDPLIALVEVAKAIRRHTSRTITKGDLSAAVTADLPAEYSAFCVPCGSTHVLEMLFRSAALPGAVGLVPGSRPVAFQRFSPAVTSPPTAARARRARTALLEDYLRIHGAAGEADLAGHLGTSAALLRRALPEGLQPVEVDGVKALSRPEYIDQVRCTDTAAARALTRLLPPGDPLLQSRQRTLLTEDPVITKALWPALGPAGAVLAGGRIAGFWRPRKAGSKLTVTVTADRLSVAQRTALEQEVAWIGELRGATASLVCGT